MTGVAVSEQVKSISAVQPSRGSGQTRGRRRSKRDAANILWKRVTASYDEDVARFAKNPALVSPITRWVLFGHITSLQGMGARRYGDIVRDFERYTMPPMARSPRSANLEPSTKSDDQEIEKRIQNGSIDDYEADARHAKRQYRRLMKVLNRYADPVTGRNYAKDHLDSLCLADREPDAQFRKDIAGVLTAVAKEFGLDQKRGR
jgi:hypothetical protein